ncbi:MAG: acylphosphatase, partial [Bacteroidota bacterium]
MIKRIQIRINGRVQGVYFRKEAQQKARELMLKGFVRNEADGSVYI